MDKLIEIYEAYEDFKARNYYLFGLVYNWLEPWVDIEKVNSRNGKEAGKEIFAHFWLASLFNWGSDKVNTRIIRKLSLTEFRKQILDFDRLKEASCNFIEKKKKLKKTELKNECNKCPSKDNCIIKRNLETRNRTTTISLIPYRMAHNYDLQPIFAGKKDITQIDRKKVIGIGMGIGENMFGFLFSMFCDPLIFPYTYIWKVAPDYSLGKCDVRVSKFMENDPKKMKEKVEEMRVALYKEKYEDFMDYLEKLKLKVKNNRSFSNALQTTMNFLDQPKSNLFTSRFITHLIWSYQETKGTDYRGDIRDLCSNIFREFRSKEKLKKPFGQPKNESPPSVLDFLINLPEYGNKEQNTQLEDWVKSKWSKDAWNEELKDRANKLPLARIVTFICYWKSGSENSVGLVTSQGL